MAGFLEGRWGGVLEGRSKMPVYMKGARGRVKEGNQIPKVQFFEQKFAV